MLVKDIYTGSFASAYPREFVNINGTLFFNARDATHGRELWKSDGTTAGTVLVKDIAPDLVSSHPTTLTNIGGTLFFGASGGLWKSDSTGSGTVEVRFFGSRSWEGVSSLTNVNGTLFFVGQSDATGLNLWKSDGTNSGTTLVRPLIVASSGSTDLVNVNGTLYFKALDATDNTR
jgi:ELWxxDGT repeat protein